MGGRLTQGLTGVRIQIGAVAAIIVTFGELLSPSSIYRFSGPFSILQPLQTIRS